MDLTTKGIKDQVSRCGGDFGRTINADLDVVRRDVGGSNRLVEGDSACNDMCIARSITDSRVAINRERSINLCIAINIEVTVYVSIICDIDSAASGIKDEVASQSADLISSICADLQVTNVCSCCTSQCMIKLDCAVYRMSIAASITDSAVAVNSECTVSESITSLCIDCEGRRYSEVISNVKSASDISIASDTNISSYEEVLTYVNS